MSGSDYQANSERVKFNHQDAEDLASACDQAASAVENQTGSRSAWRNTGLDGFEGYYANLFRGNGSVQLSAITNLAAQLRQVASFIRTLAEAASAEQKRRDEAKDWLDRKADLEAHDGFGDTLSDWARSLKDTFFAGERPPLEVTPPPTFDAVTVAPGVRQPLTGSGGSGRTSALPENLRSFASASRGGDTELSWRPASLRSKYQTFQATCQWGTVVADGVWSGFDQYLAGNEEEAVWADTVAAAFEAAGGQGVSLPDAAISAALAAAGVSASREELVIELPQAFAGDMTSGYADDPVNTATGNFTETETDLVFTGGCGSLVFDRTYNVQDTGVGGFGLGWSSWPEARLVISDDGARLTRPDGRVSVFPRLADGWDHAVGEALWLTREAPRAGESAVVSGGESSAEAVRSGMSHGENGLRSVGAGVASSAPGVGAECEGLPVKNDMAQASNDDGASSHLAAPTTVSADTPAVSSDPLAAVSADLAIDSETAPLAEDHQVTVTGGVLVVSDNQGGRWRFTPSGRLLSVSHGEGTQVTTRFNDRDRLVSLVHERGASVELVWDDHTGRIIQVVSSDGRQVDYVYDNQGRLIQARRPDGLRRYEWDGDGRISRVVDGDGVVEVDNTYDSQGRVTSQRSPSGRTSHYWYLPGRVTVVSDQDGSRGDTWVADERGRLIALTNSQGASQRMMYDRWGNRAQVIEPNGQTTLRQFDNRGRRIAEHSPTGAVIRWAWDDLDRLTQVTVTNDDVQAVTSYEYEGVQRNPSTVTDPAGGITRMTWRNGLLVEVVDPTGVRLSFEHDAHGDLIATTDAVGNTARLERDVAGRVIAAVTPLGNRTEYSYDPATGLLVSRRDPEGAVTRWEYTPAGRIKTVVDAAGGRTEMTYGPDGRRTSTTDQIGRTIDTAYDDLGNLKSVELPDGSTWQFGYDNLSQLGRFTDSTGATWQLDHDTNGQMAGATDPTGVTRTIERNPAGWATKVNDHGDDIQAAYDRLGRMIEVTGPDGTVTQNRFDICGRLIERTDPTGAATRFAYDLAGRVVAVTQPEGGTYRYEYDQCGRWITTISTGGSRYEMIYDHDSRIAGERWPDGGQVTTQFDRCGRAVERTEPGTGRTWIRYDTLGRVISVRNGLYGVRKFRYDLAGQMVEAINGLGGVTRFTYDQAGQISQVTDPAGAVTTRTYDGLGRLLTVTDPLNRTTCYRYDPAGRPISYREPSGNGLEWTYDPAGRRLETLSNGKLLSRIDRDFIGRTTTVTDGADRQVTSRFDEHGRLISRSRGDQTVSWAYDRNGRRQSMMSPDGQVTRYFYDSNSRITAIEHPQLGRVTIDRDQLGRIVSVAGDGFHATWDYTNGWLTRHTVNKRGFIQVTEIHRNEDGRVIAQTVDGLRTEFTYDPAGQLVRAVTSEGLETSYVYDEAGRLTSETSNGKTSRYTYDLAGQLITRRNPDGTETSFTYDQAGRRVHETGPEGERRFTWDPRGFLAQITRIHHDGDKVQAQSRTLSVDPTGELAQIDGTPIWWDSASAVPQTLTVGDTATIGLGSLQALIDGDTVTWSDSHDTDTSDPWALSTPGRITNGIGLVDGQVTIDGLRWLGVRVFDPDSRGFLSTDPLIAPPGATWTGNPYSYAANDPVNQADPWGLKPVSISDFQEYRNSLPGGLLQQAGDWLKSNWEYIAAGAMVIAGGVMMATGVGGPVGMALISAGADAIIQKATTGTVDWGQVAVNGVVGLVSGGVAGAAGRAMAGKVTSCLGKNILSGAVEGAVDSGISGAVGYLTSGEPLTISGFAQATLGNAAIGTLTGGAFGGLSKVTGTSQFGCFEEDTPVLMADGSHKPIQDVQTGDLVMAFNPDTGDTEPQPVTETYIHEDVATIRVTTTAGEIVTTVNHPFYVEDRGYTPACELHENDQLKTPDGSDVTVVSIQATGKTQTVYNLNIAEQHNYYVCAKKEAVLVHNDGCDDVISETLNHSGKKDFTSQYSLTEDEALDTGIQWLGDGYREMGQPGTGVFRSIDDTRQFRIDSASLSGSHPPNVPHVHLELLDQKSGDIISNNHVRLG
jgi:RHS repeat-associated protein